MAEGTVPEGLEMETGAEIVAVEGLLVEETQEKVDQPVVRPKIRQTRGEGYQEEEGFQMQRPQTAQTATGERWHSSALTGSKMPSPPHLGTSFQGWRERRWMEDEDGEWSYATGPGPSTMGTLRERFGEASFRDAPS